MSIVVDIDPAGGRTSDLLIASLTIVHGATMCSGVYVNGHRIIDKRVLQGDESVVPSGDVSVATRPFTLPPRKSKYKATPVLLLSAYCCRVVFEMWLR